MRDLFDFVIRSTHWPSWLRGASVTMLIWATANGMMDVAVIAILLYAFGHWLVRYFPYTPLPKR